MLVSLSFSLAAQKKDLLIRRLSLQLYGQPVGSVLELISERTGIFFSYDSSILDTGRLISVNVLDEPAGKLVEQILGPEFQTSLYGDQLIISLRKASDYLSAGGISPPSPDLQIITGTVSDAGSGEPVPYASVSVQEEPFGTITNRDGRFELKIPDKYRHRALVFSCMGYARARVDTDTLRAAELNIGLLPVNIHLKEIEISAVDPRFVLDRFEEHIRDNYPGGNRLMSAFYREVLLQDKTYVNVAEAVIHILKSPYGMSSREDKIRFLKGRKSFDVQPFRRVDFKMQGGPYYMTKLDVVRTMETFLDSEYRQFYRYQTERLIDFSGRPTYVIRFEPAGKIDFPSYEGKLYFDRESWALVYAEFNMGKNGLRYARKSLIRKKPKGFNVKPLELEYRVAYRLHEGLWSLNAARTSARFRVRSRNDRVNSVFHSISDLLVTQMEETGLKRFDKEETFLPTDIFTEMIIDYDQEFWGDFNTIRPDEDLRRAIKRINPGSEAAGIPGPGRYATGNKGIINNN